MANSILNKDKPAILLLFKSPEVLPSPSVKANLFAKIFSNNSNFDDLSVSLPVFLLELI